MTWLLVSDLHLGTRSGADLARGGAVRAPLVQALDGADELVLLGDVLELRDGPVGPALAASRDFFEALGAALGRRRVVIVPGNHDYRLVAPWLDRRRRAGAAPLGPEQRIAPAEASDAAAAIAGWLGPARLELAYPGLWLASGVYATHGHYLDRHITVPSIEPLSVHAVERFLRRRGPVPGGPEGYEAVTAPVYALLQELAQVLPSNATAGAGPSQRAYRVLVGRDGRRRPVRHRLLSGIAFPALVGALNASGLGPVRADLSGPELRRASLRAMGEVMRRLGIEARHVVFGHTHRAGPLPGDDESEWQTPEGARLYNAGTWIFERFLVRSTPADSPYWPGSAIVVDGDGPPRLVRLLEDRSLADLKTPGPA